MKPNIFPCPVSTDLRAARERRRGSRVRLLKQLMKPLTDKQREAILSACDEMTRLSLLTDKQLVAECAQQTLSDSPIVMELMNRIDPMWLIEEGKK